MSSKLLRSLRESFRYANCDAMVGQRLSLTGVSEIATDLSQFAADLTPDNQLALIDEDFDLMFGTIAKFGVLDIKFTAPKNLETTVLDPTTAIRELGFLSSNESNVQFDGDPNYCLKKLLEGIEPYHEYLQLFLKTTDRKISDVSSVERIKRVKDHSQIPFPIELTVVDACITNSNFAWFKKHNYTLLYVLNTY